VQIFLGAKLRHRPLTFALGATSVQRTVLRHRGWYRLGLEKILLIIHPLWVRMAVAREAFLP
jgi:hypothetical protein